MEPKKNPKANVGRNSSLYFAIGLMLMLFLTNFAINYKTYDKSAIDIGQLNLDAELEEEIPITQQEILPPPPPPPPAPTEVIEIVKDEEEIEETVIQSTETNQQEKIVEVKQIVTVEVEEEEEVPFAVIENVPTYPGCEKGDNNAKKKCMSDKIQEFIGNKFNTDLASDLGLSGRQRITVLFKIDKTGAITGVQSRAPHPALEKEAARVVNLLPKMLPGKQRGKPVTVPYSLPIVFVVQE